VTGFRDFLRSLNKGLLADDILNRRPPIKGEVIEVSEKDRVLDPTTEVAEIQRMINAHNIAFRMASSPQELNHGILSVVIPSTLVICYQRMIPVD